MKSKRRDMDRFYQSAEVWVDEVPGTDTEAAQRLISLRFKTLDVVKGKHSPGTTPWVTFSIPLMEDLANQLQAVVEQAKSWMPGQGVPPISSPGLVSEERRREIPTDE